jgi:hypothetical protein
MSPVSLELKQVACIKTESSYLAAGAKIEGFADFKPTNREKVVQKAGRDSLWVPREDIEESLRFGRVVEAGWLNVRVNTGLEQTSQKWKVADWAATMCI